MSLSRILLLIAIGMGSTAACEGSLVLTSPVIKSDATLGEEQVLNGFGCSGKNKSPALQWTAGPKGTRSYAVTVYDPDAPTGSGWWHWVVYNIPARTTELVTDAGDSRGQQLPAGAVQGRTDFGTHEYGGACPPRGDKPHRYIFTVQALKIEKIEVPAEASAALIGFTINANSIGKATLTARYGR